VKGKVSQCVLRKGNTYIKAVHIPAKLAVEGLLIDYKVDWHIWYSCRPGRPCTCNLDWREGWTVHEVWSTHDLWVEDIDGKRVKTVYAVKARRHESR